MSRTPDPASLTDAQRANMARLVPPPQPGGRPAKYDRREVADGIPHVARTGCSGRSLPTGRPAGRVCFRSFRRWQPAGTWDRIPAALRATVRRAAGRRRRPTPGGLDRQTVEATEQGGPRGFDGGGTGHRPPAARGG